MRHGRPERDAVEAAVGRLLVHDADDAGRSFVRVRLESQTGPDHRVVRGRRHRDGAGVRHVRQQRAEGDGGGRTEPFRDVEELGAGVTPPPKRLVMLSVRLTRLPRLLASSEL